MQKRTISIAYSPHFVKRFRTLPSSIQKKAINREKIFRRNMFAPSLKTHKLKGKLADYYAFSIDYHYRILFAIESTGETTFINIGSHSIYQE